MAKIINKEELQEVMETSAEEIEKQKYAVFASEILYLPKMNYKLNYEMEEGEKQAIKQTWIDRLALYLEACIAHEVKISNEAAYAYLGLTKAQIDAMMTGQEPWQPEHFAFATKVKQLCAVAREQMLYDGRINYTLGIFQSKIHDGYVESTTVINVNREDIEEPQTAEQLAAKYLEKLPMGEI